MPILHGLLTLVLRIPVPFSHATACVSFSRILEASGSCSLLLRDTCSSTFTHKFIIAERVTGNSHSRSSLFSIGYSVEYLSTLADPTWSPQARSKIQPSSRPCSFPTLEFRVPFVSKHDTELLSKSRSWSALLTNAIGISVR